MLHTSHHGRKNARHRRGFLTFEWILLISLLVIGVIGGLSAVRDALILELKDLSDCVKSLQVGPQASQSSPPQVFAPGTSNPNSLSLP